MPRDEKDGGSGPGALVWSWAWAASDGFSGVAMVLVEVKRELLRGRVAWDWGERARSPKVMLFLFSQANSLILHLEFLYYINTMEQRIEAFQAIIDKTFDCTCLINDTP